MPNVAINGLGRIGRATLKILLDTDGLDLVAVNDIASADNLAYLVKYDTVYGRYHRELMNAILNDRCQIAKAVNATVISLDDAPRGYQDFDGGVAKKFVLDPHGMLGDKQRIGA